MRQHGKWSKDMTRREALRAFGVAGAAAFVGCNADMGLGNPDAGEGTDLTPAGAGGDLAGSLDGGALDCVVTPALTEGPFFVDEKLNRSDITAGTSEPFVTGGIPIKLAFGVYSVTGATCAPLAGAQLDIWHASAEGVYSDEASGMIQSKSTVGEKYLRGFQLTDANGQAAFTSIYPGWYMGRTIHVHFKVRIFAGAQKTFEFTSQVYVDDTINDAVMNLAPYNTRGQRSVRNANDNVFGGGATNSALLLNVKKDSAGAGYTGTFNMGVKLS